jgi:hypothetical protein
MMKTIAMLTASLAAVQAQEGVGRLLNGALVDIKDEENFNLLCDSTDADCHRRLQNNSDTSA